MNIKKITYSVTIRLYIKFVEKKFNHKGRAVKYLLQESKGSDKLIVAFSGFPGQGGKARYNYIRSLKKVKCNKLFILDDFGYQKSGSYYLAENGDFELETAISALIDLLRRQLSPKSSIYLGSSKGGYAALYYGLTHEAEHIIIGAPQYYLGQYLDTEKHRPILNGIMGNDSKGSIQKLDNLLHNKIFSSKGIKSKVYVHYSKNEHTYEEHIKDLIKDLRENEIECIEDIKDFLNHSDVSKHFPAFLNEVIKKINKKEPIKV